MYTLPLDSVVGFILIPALTIVALILAGLSWGITPRPPHQESVQARTGAVPSVILAAGSASALAAAILLTHLPDNTITRTGALTVPIMVLLALALAAVGGSAFTTAILSLATRTRGGIHGGIVVAQGPDAETEEGESAHVPRKEILRGGTTIGVLERISAAGAIIAGFPEALAIIVALKGVGRFTELSTSEAKERFIIGSIASLLWACACTMLVR